MLDPIDSLPKEREHFHESTDWIHSFISPEVLEFNMFRHATKKAGRPPRTLVEKKKTIPPSSPSYEKSERNWTASIPHYFFLDILSSGSCACDFERNGSEGNGRVQWIR